MQATEEVYIHSKAKVKDFGADQSLRDALGIRLHQASLEVIECMYGLHNNSRRPADLPDASHQLKSLQTSVADAPMFSGRTAFKRVLSSLRKLSETEEFLGLDFMEHQQMRRMVQTPVLPVFEQFLLAVMVKEACSLSTAKFDGIIPTEAIEKRYMLSSGPGGQNVQKNATKVEIRFNLRNAYWLSDELKDGLEKRLANRINAKGELIIESDRTRERHLNLADCFDKLRSTIYDVQRTQNLCVETEEDTAIIRKKAELAAQRRLAEKRRDAQNRRLRAIHI
ncbi:hypothetical protein KIN20_025768 [Parelaphostrongylus tenuis]|uniref:Large ribosomal subunit protein mL62 n=1 Tax=Parelaphostrongylus tenuis TaxID=148309 RepID=A0AAD5NB08_PARTN|nr:hypothetical protein KIN20_025768 [Parelaphostrongylus tenuis]